MVQGVTGGSNTNPIDQLALFRTSSDPQTSAKKSGAVDGVGIPALDAASAGPKTPAYRAAINSYDAAEAQSIAALGLTQRLHNQPITRFHEGPPVKGLAIFFHGLDAGTSQWADHLDATFNAGYDIFVPALPGHGLVNASGEDDTSHIPNSGNPEQWDQFVDQINTLIKGAPVTLIGLSAGGMCALKLAERHNSDAGEKIKQVIAVSPFLGVGGDYYDLGPIHITNATVAHVFQAVESFVLTKTPARWFLKQQKVDFHAGNRTDYGAKTVDQDIVLGLVDAADSTDARAKTLRGLPIQMIISAADTSAAPEASRAFARASGADVYEFPKEQNVPHAMISQLENTNEASLATLKQLIQERLSRA